MSISCPGPLAPICDVANAVGSGTPLGAGFNLVLTAVTGWVVSAAGWLLSQLGTVVTATTKPDLGAAWYGAHYRTMLSLAAVVALPMLLVAVVQAVIRQDPGVVARVALIQLPLAALLSGVALSGVQLSLSITDWLSSVVASGSGSQLQQVLSSMSTALVAGPGGGAPGLVVALAAVVVVGGALTLWMELLVREAAVYVATLFLPLALAGLVWPAVSHWSRRLVETLAAVVLSKFVIVTVLSLAVGALATAGAGPGTGGLATVLAGAAMLLLAAFTPWTLLRLIPLAEASAAAHLEAAHRRVAGSWGNLPRSAATLAMQRANDAGLDAGTPSMGKHGAADMAAMTGGGTVGGAGAGGDVGGPGGDGSGNDGARRPDDDGDGELRYYWSDGTDGGPPGLRQVPHPEWDQALAQRLARLTAGSREAIGGLGNGWTRPIWGGEPPSRDGGADDDEITLDDGRDLNDPDLPPIWGD